MSGWRKTAPGHWQRSLGDGWIIECERTDNNWCFRVWEQSDPDWDSAYWQCPVLEEALAEVAAELVKDRGYHDLAARVMRLRGPRDAQQLSEGER